MEEKKEQTPVDTTTQAPAKVEEKPEKKEAKGLDGFTPEQLRELYKNSPSLFKEAGIVKEEKKVEEKPPVKPQSAAPAGKTAKYGESEIKLPEDVNEQMVGSYFDHWKENGWSPEQVQKEVDFQGQLAAKAKQAQETPEQRAKRLDAANVETLKKAWGADYDKNLEVARQAAKKYGTPEMIAKALNSDPVTVKQFYEFGKLDIEDRTPDKGTPRGGKEEEKDKQMTREEYNKKRYPNSPTMKF